MDSLFLSWQINSFTFLSSQQSLVEIDHFSEWINISDFWEVGNIICSKLTLTWSFCYDLEDPTVIDKLLTATLTTPTTLSCLFSGLKQWLSSFLLLSSIWTPTKYATWTNRGFSKTKTPEAPRYVKVEFSNSQYNLVEFVLWHYFYQKFTIKKGQNKLVSIYILHKDFQFSLYTTKIEV